MPSQLAYSEHRIGYQHPNAISYNPQDYAIKLPRQPEYNQQQLFSQPQQIFNQQTPIQPIYQQIPQSNYQPQQIAYNQQPIQYSPQTFKQLERQQLQGLQYQQPAKPLFQENQQNVFPAHYNLAPQPYFEPQQQYQQPAYVPAPLQNVQIPQPGITYARQEETQQKIFTQPAQIYDKPQFVAQVNDTSN